MFGLETSIWCEIRLVGRNCATIVLPSGISCSFNLPSGVLSPNGTLTTALTVSVTSKPGAFQGLPPTMGRPPGFLLPLMKLAVFASVLVLLLLAYDRLRFGHRLLSSTAYSALFLVVVLIAAVSCGGGAGGAPGAPPPTVSLQASPDSISTGGSSTLTWNSTNATQLSISPGVGSVGPQGSTTIQPTSSTTYTISASGPGGSTSASATVTVKSSQTVMVTVQAASPSVTVTPGSIPVSIP